MLPAEEQEAWWFEGMGVWGVKGGSSKGQGKMKKGRGGGTHVENIVSTEHFAVELICYEQSKLIIGDKMTCSWQRWPKVTKVYL